jgi:hypothetical protein
MPGERHPSQVTVTVPSVHQREDIEARADALLPALASTQACRALFQAVPCVPAAVDASVAAACEQRLNALSDIEGADVALSKLPSFAALVVAAAVGFAHAHAHVPLPTETAALPAPLVAAHEYGPPSDFMF